MVTRRTIALLFTLTVFAAGLLAQPERKLKKPASERAPVTQKLEIPREPPMVVSAETGKLVFDVSPLSAKGLLSQQVHDAIKALDRATGGATIVKLRAFVAGAGDLRRVATIVSADFSARKLPLPVVTTVQVGALPLEGAQVVIESTSVDKKTVNPTGLRFFSVQSVGQLRSIAQDKGSTMVRLTCFLSSLDNVNAVRSDMAATFPRAAAVFVQLTRVGLQPVADCEAVARPSQDSEVLLPTARSKLLFTGLQMAFSDQESDIQLAFDRLGKVLESQGSSYGEVLFTSIYALNPAAAGRAAAIRLDALRGREVASSAEVFEGLPSLGAMLGVEITAVMH